MDNGTQIKELHLKKSRNDVEIAVEPPFGLYLHVTLKHTQNTHKIITDKKTNIILFQLNWKPFFPRLTKCPQCDFISQNLETKYENRCTYSANFPIFSGVFFEHIPLHNNNKWFSLLFFRV